jgi:hypothetical protein
MTAPAVGLAAFLSDHHFRLPMGACTLSLILMMTPIYATVGFGPSWGSPASLPG